MKEIDLRTASTAALAYLGDSVLELYVRRTLVAKGYGSSKSLNAHARHFVSAPAQAQAMERLLPHLSPEEEAIFKRGRNIGHTRTPKNATVAEYRAATGMEVLFGYLFAAGNEARLTALFEIGYEENTI